MWLFLAFVLIPIVEIALFIQVGGWLGLLPTLAIVVATAALGTVLVRRQGLAQMRAVQASLSTLSDPTGPLAHGALVLASGLLLLTPGFFTDAVGFALLVPAVREAVIAAVRSRVKVKGFAMGAAPRPARHDIIDGDYVEMPRRDGPSGWTQGSGRGD